MYSKVDVEGVVDPELKPRIEAIPENVSKKARALFQTSLVWDALMPFAPDCNFGALDDIMPRYIASGVNYISLTMSAGGFVDTGEVFKHIGVVRRQISERTDRLIFARSVSDIRRAQTEGKLALGLNFQETLPFGRNLETVQLFYDLGVRQALLAYNQKNLVGDGCAERTDSGLSRYGVSLVREMNRVGIIVDGTHSGYRTTMDAMEVCSAPFIFSHSNPFAVRSHYRSIKDDQIKACAATGGVIGINGVGAWVGDMDAPTDVIFRNLDYVVQLVGPKHVGLGWDYVHDLDQIIGLMRADRNCWPPYKGEEFVKHNYAGSEQMVELVQYMLDAGYPEPDIKGILGENWLRVASAVWK